MPHGINGISGRGKYPVLLRQGHLKLECRRAISPTPLNLRGIFSSFPPFFRGLGAGVTGIPPVRIISVILIRLLIAMLGTSTGKII